MIGSWLQIVGILLTMALGILKGKGAEPACLCYRIFKIIDIQNWNHPSPRAQRTVFIYLNVLKLLSKSVLVLASDHTKTVPSHRVPSFI